MSISRRGLLGTATFGAGVLPLIGQARAQGAPSLKIGILTDLSGPYQDLAGPLAVKAAQLATEDFGVAGKGFTVEILQADHQNKPDVGAGIARQWYDSGVDLIAEVANSGVALAVAGVAKDKNKVYMNSGAATSDLTAAQCNANTIHWAYDTYMLAKSTGGALVKAGGDSWFFITADYAFGAALQRDTTEFVTGAGGKVVGSVKYPFPGTTDFSSFLLQRQSSKRCCPQNRGTYAHDGRSVGGGDRWRSKSLVSSRIRNTACFGSCSWAIGTFRRWMHTPWSWRA